MHVFNFSDSYLIAVKTGIMQALIDVVTSLTLQVVPSAVGRRVASAENSIVHGAYFEAVTVAREVDPSSINASA